MDSDRPSTIVQHQSLPERVHQILRDRILAKELPAGTLLIELDLSEEFGVSRTTIRSALRELKAERLIEVSPRRGSSVSRMSAELSMEICMARYALEGADLERVLRADRPGLTARMEDALGAMKDAASSGDLSALVQADTDLHRHVVAAADLPLLLDLWQGLNGQMAALMLSSLDRQGIDLQESVRRHAELIEDFRTMRPAQAVKALREHYVNSPVATSTVPSGRAPGV
jgi:DNA-binding GntR family transcriptional regulator